MSSVSLGLGRAIDLAVTKAGEEVAHARAKHGMSIEGPEVNNDRRNTILVEEVGEISTALNELEIAGRPSASSHRYSPELEAARVKMIRDEIRFNLRSELAQVAATALRWLATEIEAEQRRERVEADRG